MFNEDKEKSFLYFLSEIIEFRYCIISMIVSKGLF